MRILPVIFLAYLLGQVNGYGQNWQALGSGCLGEPQDFLEKNGKLYIAGPYRILNDTVNGICSFDGQYFDTLGPGLYGAALSLVYYNNELIAGGNFSFAGVWPGIPGTQAIAKWDGSSWQSVGGGVTGSGIEDILCMAVYNGELYVGGIILNVGNVPVGRIAKWNGNTWSNVGGGFSGQALVQCMTVYNNELIVGGYFNLPGAPNNYYYNIARWDGVQWDSLGGKANGWITSLEVDTINNLLYAGGGVTDIAGTSIWSVGVWNGSAWSAPGFSPTDGALDMRMFMGKVHVGGIATSPATLASWDGLIWSAINPDPNNSVISLGLYNNNLYVGGYFDSIGSQPMNHIACYGFTCPTTVGFRDRIATEWEVNVFPNPASDVINVEAKSIEEMTLTLTDAMGKTVREGRFRQKALLPVSSLLPGLYYLRVCGESGKNCGGGKVVIE